MSCTSPLLNAKYASLSFILAALLNATLYPPITSLKNESLITLNSLASILASIKSKFSLITRADCLILNYFINPIRSEYEQCSVRSRSYWIGVQKEIELLYRHSSYQRYCWVGWSRKMWVSMRPGRSRAGSISYGLELAATIYTPYTDATPSRQHRNWLTTLSVTLVLEAFLLGTIDQNSSKKIMLGLTVMAFSKISRTAASLPPIYLLSISEPLTLKNFILNSPASASPMADFPTPEPPYNNTPLESLTGNFLNTKLYLRGLSTIVLSIFLASLIPANLEKSISLEFQPAPSALWPEIMYLLNQPKDIDQEFQRISVGLRLRLRVLFVWRWVVSTWLRVYLFGFLSLMSQQFWNYESILASFLAVKTQTLLQTLPNSRTLLQTTFPATISILRCKSPSQTRQQTASKLSKNNKSPSYN